MSKLHSGENGLQGAHQNGRGFLMASARYKSQGIRDEKGARSNYSSKAKMMQTMQQGEGNGDGGGGGRGGVSSLLRTDGGVAAAVGGSKKIVKSTFGTRGSIVVGMTDMSLEAKKDLHKVCFVSQHSHAHSYAYSHTYSHAHTHTLTHTHSHA